MATFLTNAVTLGGQRVIHTLDALLRARIVGGAQIIASHGQLVLPVAHAAQNRRIAVLERSQFLAGQRLLDSLTQLAFVVRADRAGMLLQIGMIVSDPVARANGGANKFFESPGQEAP